jgi:hypothetical protein
VIGWPRSRSKWDAKKGISQFPATCRIARTESSPEPAGAKLDGRSSFSGTTQRGRRWRSLLGTTPYRGTTMKHATGTTILRSSYRSLVGDLLWLATIAFVFAILTGIVQ